MLTQKDVAFKSASKWTVVSFVLEIIIYVINTLNLYNHLSETRVLDARTAFHMGVWLLMTLTFYLLSKNIAKLDRLLQPKQLPYYFLLVVKIVFILGALELLAARGLYARFYFTIYDVVIALYLITPIVNGVTLMKIHALRRYRDVETNE